MLFLRVGILRLQLAVISLLSLTAIARGSLWQSTDWALTGTMDGMVGYDSNLTMSQNGPEDFFAEAKPSLTLLRRNSSTDFRVNGGVTHTEFVNGRQSAYTDLMLDMIYAYPNVDHVIPDYRTEISWQRSSSPNQYLGERARKEQLSIESEAYLSLTGKLGLRGIARFDSSDYKKQSLNKNRRSEAIVGLAYQRTRRSEISLNLGGVSGQSKPNDPARISSDVHSKELYVTAHLRGEITAKISGNLFVGYGRASYTGGYVQRNYFTMGGADLTWKLDPRRTLVLTADRRALFSPEGQAGTVTRGRLSFTQIILDRWQYSVHAGPTHYVSSRAVRQRTDDSWDVGVEFAYRPSDRFGVSLGLDYTNQNSDNNAFDFDREVVSLGASYHF